MPDQLSFLVSAGRYHKLSVYHHSLKDWPNTLTVPGSGEMQKKVLRGYAEFSRQSIKIIIMMMNCQYCATIMSYLIEATQSKKSS